ncbi:hypothetical protein Bca101_017946 [Brassica carinata]
MESNYHNYTLAVKSGKKAMQEVLLNWYKQISKVHNIYRSKNWAFSIFLTFRNR